MKFKYIKEEHKGIPLYCFVSTNSNDVISKIENSNINWKNDIINDNFITYLYTNKKMYDKKSGIVSLSLINDLVDYDIQEICNILKRGDFIDNILFDSILSVSCVSKKYFSCMNDFWGIMSHYYYRTTNTFICSNNIFMINEIVKKKISSTALYEYLFFLYPRNDETWFTNIKRLLPGQQLVFDMKSNSLRLSKSTDFSKLSKSRNKNYVDSIKDFFLLAKKKIGYDNSCTLGISAGADTRTILACLKHTNMKYNTVSFGMSHLIETNKIIKFVNKFHIPWKLIDLKGYEKKFINLFKRETCISNGSLNPLRTHYLYYYDKIKYVNFLFEGILCDELVKGKVALNTSISPLHQEVIVNSKPIDLVIDMYYPELSFEFRHNMAEYITANYNDDLIDINLDEGLENWKMFLFDFIPSKVFGGLILLVINNGINPYYPFLSPKVLESIYCSGNGMILKSSIRDDFIGNIKCMKVLAEITKSTDNKMFTSLLDRNISLKDSIIYPDLFLLPKRIILKIIDSIKYRKYLAAQIDNRKIRNIIKSAVDKDGEEILPCNNANENFLISKAMVNLRFINNGNV